jgi:glycosyltransferase involved in cell wall biosynthesis
MRALSELFDETTLLMEDGGREAEQGDIPLAGHALRVAPIARPREPFGHRKLGVLLWAVAQFPRLLRELRAHDAVHTPVPCDTGTIAMLLAWMLRKPLYVRHCGNWLETASAADRFWKWFMTRTAGGRNVMLATGGSTEPPTRKNTALRWIFSTSLTGEEMDAYKAHVRMYPRGAIRLMTVGRQERGKGTDIALEALALLRSGGLDARMDVAGEGGALPALREHAAALGLDPFVAFHGRVDHRRVMELLAEAHIFCFPTASEGFPKAVLEALASGLPVVTTPVSVLPLLIGGGAGRLLPARTPGALADAVRDILADPDRYAAMCAAARATASRYTIEAWQGLLRDAFSAAWGYARRA